MFTKLALIVLLITTKINFENYFRNAIYICGLWVFIIFLKLSDCKTSQIFSRKKKSKEEETEKEYDQLKINELEEKVKVMFHANLCFKAAYCLYPLIGKIILDFSFWAYCPIL